MGKLFNLLFCFVFAVNLICVSNEQTKNVHLCADAECQKAISTAETIKDYVSDKKEKLSFHSRTIVQVYSKEKDRKNSLWEIKVGGKRGLVPYNFLKETKIHVKSEDLVSVDYDELKRREEMNKSALKGSMLTTAIETSTTPPLPNEPGSVTSQLANESSTNPDEILSDSSKSRIVAGTELAADLVDVEERGEFVGKDDNQDDEFDTSVEEDEDGLDSNNTAHVDNNINEESLEVRDNKNTTSSLSLHLNNIIPGLSQPIESKVEKGNKQLMSEDTNKLAPLAEEKQNSSDNKAAMDSRKIPVNNADSLENPQEDKGNETVVDDYTTNETNQTASEVSGAENGLQIEQPKSTAPATETVENVTKSALNSDNLQQQDQNSDNSKNLNSQNKVGENRQNESAILDVQKKEPLNNDGGEGKEDSESNSAGFVSSEEKERTNKVSTTTKEETEGVKENAMSITESNNEADHNKKSEEVQKPGEENRLSSSLGDGLESKSSQNQPSIQTAGEEQKSQKLNNLNTLIHPNRLFLLPKQTLDPTIPLESSQTTTGSSSKVSDKIGVSKTEERISKEGSADLPKAESWVARDSATNPTYSEKVIFTTEPAIESVQAEVPLVSDSPEYSTERTPQTFTEDPVVEQQGNFEEIPTESTEATMAIPTIQQDSSNAENYSEQVKNDWFSNVFEAMSNFWSTQPKEESTSGDDFNAETLSLDKVEQSKEVTAVPAELEGYCEKLTPDLCPSEPRKLPSSTHLQARNRLDDTCSSEKDFFSSLSDKVLEMVDLLACLLIAALTTLIFAFGYYCICHSRKEGVLISKLNVVERSLLAATKESAILKHDLIETRNKLHSIEDNSFGSNDMVIVLKKELQESEEMKIELQKQIASLEKELETAAETGLELNKIVTELLNNQSGDESIISSVEELQKQLNEQQNTIIQINTTLAEKSRENSELQLIITNQAARFDEEVKELKQEKEELKKDKAQVEAELEELQQKMNEELSKAEESKRVAIVALTKDMAVLKDKYDEVQKRLQSSEARVQVLEECLNGVKNSAKFNIRELLDAVNLKTELLAIRRERDSLKDRLEGEIDARKLLEDHVAIISEDVSRLKQDYNQSEKEKVEAKTRLEVLSSYFKEKETQLQKELSLKEALWLKQQGETSSTVERVQHMQDEIQFLKSKNDSLRAEIEAQTATHKAQIANLENRAHEAWLAARQSERKLEESRIEATALRRKLTTLAGNPTEVNSQTRVPNSTDGLQNDVNNVPSPVHMESPGSPLIGGLPPPLPFLPPPPFMAPPHPFMPMPPPFMPPGEMRPPPLGRLMSPPPPPPPDRYSPNIVDERNRYSPENGRYSPDSRYNYTTDIMSNYDTETDFSPPPSPEGRPGGGNPGSGYSSRERDRNRDRERSRAYKAYSPPPQNSTDRNKKSKGILSSGSADSYDSRKSKGKRKV